MNFDQIRDFIQDFRAFVCRVCRVLLFVLPLLFVAYAWVSWLIEAGQQLSEFAAATGFGAFASLFMAAVSIGGTLALGSWAAASFESFELGD
jgi:hypothetical protein